ncbi:MAG: AraC family transcriptional regulator [Hungatella sp.]|nr:AraC family transcriptional regulator [Hungatella sp.]
MQAYRAKHQECDKYRLTASLPGLKRYWNALGWADYWFGEHMVYSHREVHYNFSTFHDNIHNHGFYELNITHKGSVSFIFDNQYITPKLGSILLFRPGHVHTAKLLAECNYERSIFFFDEKAFDLFGADSRSLNLLKQEAAYLEFPSELEDILYATLGKIDNALSGDSPNTALLTYSHILYLFCVIDRYAVSSRKGLWALPPNILKIKQYIDEHYLTINTTAEIAEHFFYRREHISRLFRKYFDANLSDYLASLKIRHSQKLLSEGASVTDACYQSGFRNMSTFIVTFRNHVYMNPSAYQKEIRRKESSQ